MPDCDQVMFSKRAPFHPRCKWYAVKICPKFALILDLSIHVPLFHEQQPICCTFLIICARHNIVYSVPSISPSLTANSFTKLFAFSTTFCHCRIVDSRFLNPGQQCYDDSGKSVLPMSFCISAVAATFKRLFNSRGVLVKPISKRTGWNFKALSNIRLA